VYVLIWLLFTSALSYQIIENPRDVLGKILSNIKGYQGPPDHSPDIMSITGEIEGIIMIKYKYSWGINGNPFTR